LPESPALSDVSQDQRLRPILTDLGLATETLAQTEHAVLELASLLNAEVRMTEIILQALLFSYGVVSSDASGPKFTSHGTWSARHT
jgi:hypothetical protein